MKVESSRQSGSSGYLIEGPDEGVDRAGAVRTRRGDRVARDRRVARGRALSLVKLDGGGTKRAGVVVDRRATRRG